jgi:hypothetical protein
MSPIIRLYDMGIDQCNYLSYCKSKTIKFFTYQYHTPGCHVVGVCSNHVYLYEEAGNYKEVTREEAIVLEIMES